MISSFIVLSMHILSMTIVKSKTNESLNNNSNNQPFNGRSMINLHFHFKLENEINSRRDLQTRLKLDSIVLWSIFAHIHSEYDDIIMRNVKNYMWTMEFQFFKLNEKRKNKQNSTFALNHKWSYKKEYISVYIFNTITQKCVGANEIISMAKINQRNKSEYAKHRDTIIDDCILFST